MGGTHLEASPLLAAVRNGVETRWVVAVKVVGARKHGN